MDKVEFVARALATRWLDETCTDRLWDELYDATQQDFMEQAAAALAATEQFESMPPEVRFAKEFA